MLTLIFQAFTFFLILLSFTSGVSLSEDIDYQSPASDEDVRDIDEQASSLQTTPFPLEIQDQHLFSDSILTYDPDYMNKNHDTSTNNPNDPGIETKMKIWLKDKIDNIIEKIENNEKVDKKNDENHDINNNIITLSTLAPNEVYLPIDIEHLVPKKRIVKKILTNSEHFYSESRNVPVTVLPSSFPTTTVRSSTSKPPTAATEKATILTTSTTTTTNIPSTAVPEVSTLTFSPKPSSTTNNQRNSTFVKQLSKARLWKNQLQALKNVSFDIPEKRILTSYPMRRLMMAYFAPRILRFQAAMVLSTLMSEVSRKVFDPLVGNFVGTNIAKGLTPSLAGAIQAPLKTTTTTTTPTPLSSILSELSNSGNANSLSPILSQLTPLLGGILNNVPPTQERSLVAEESTIKSEHDSGHTSLTNLLKQFKPSELQTFTQLINNIDSKQLSSFVSLMQTLSPLLKSNSPNK